MMAKDPYQNYKQNAVMSASPEELVTMLYNRLIKDLQLAQRHVANKNIQSAHNSIIHAQDILIHLTNTLDTSLEVGQNLNTMYSYMIRRLVEANTKKDCNILQEVISHAKEIRDAWVQAVNQVKSGIAIGK